MTETIFRNLISNAVKFSNEYGLISIDGVVKDNLTEIIVKDTGTGITKENIAKLFRISESKINSGTKNEKGSGLGLLLCKELVEINGGTIAVESEWGKGSTFMVALPRC